MTIPPTEILAKARVSKNVKDQQRYTTLAFASSDSRIEIPTAPTKNPKSETMISTTDDAELLKDLRGE